MEKAMKFVKIGGYVLCGLGCLGTIITSGFELGDNCKKVKNDLSVNNTETVSKDMEA